MNRLEEIKEEFAKEKGFEDYSELLLQNSHSFGDLDNVVNELSTRYAKECMQSMADNIQLELFNSQNDDGEYVVSLYTINNIDSEQYIKLL